MYRPDGRTLHGVPNFWNVISNIPFFLVALYGIKALRSRAAFVEPWERTAYCILLAGTAAVGVGSTYYHLQPDNARLVWDRLPMTVVFTSLVAVTIGERISRIPAVDFKVHPFDAEIVTFGPHAGWCGQRPMTKFIKAKTCQVGPTACPETSPAATHFVFAGHIPGPATHPSRSAVGTFFALGACRRAVSSGVEAWRPKRREPCGRFFGSSA